MAHITLHFNDTSVPVGGYYVYLKVHGTLDPYALHSVIYFYSPAIIAGLAEDTNYDGFIRGLCGADFGPPAFFSTVT